MQNLKKILTMSACSKNFLSNDPEQDHPVKNDFLNLNRDRDHLQKYWANKSDYCSRALWFYILAKVQKPQR